MSQILSVLADNNLAFPPLNKALKDPNGLIAIGGDLSPSRIIQAYTHGIFPWFSENDPLLWWSPDPRAIIQTEDIIINRTLRKVINRGAYKITLNKAFEQVIALCADAPFRKQATWILADMQSAYIQLHNKGFAHSVEVWQDDKLIGGLYGIAIGGYFSGESMFYCAPNGSKLALIALSQLLYSINVQFIDCQFSNHFLADMGCIEVSREEFMQKQTQAMCITIPPQFWMCKTLSLNSCVN